MTSGSAFSAANGVRSSGRQARSHRRSVVSSCTRELSRFGAAPATSREIAIRVHISGSLRPLFAAAGKVVAERLFVTRRGKLATHAMSAERRRSISRCGMPTGSDRRSSALVRRAPARSRVRCCSRGRGRIGRSSPVRARILRDARDRRAHAGVRARLGHRAVDGHQQDVELLKAPAYPAAAGTQSLDMVGTQGAGAGVQQTFDTPAGNYVVTYKVRARCAGDVVVRANGPVIDSVTSRVPPRSARGRWHSPQREAHRSCSSRPPRPRA